MMDAVFKSTVKAAWSYEYPFGALFQHSVKLSDRLAFSPFFALERGSGHCLWEAPVAADRSTMLCPRALTEGVIVAEKYEVAAGLPEFRGIFRFDAATGTALESLASSGGSLMAGVQGWLRGQRRGLVDLTTARLLSVAGSDVSTFGGDVVDIRTGNRVRAVPKAAKATPDCSLLIKLDANAAFISIPGFGELYPGAPPSASHSGGGDRFWNRWPHSFHLRRGEDVIWAYDNKESRSSGITSSLTYDQILVPNLYSLLYEVRAEDRASTIRDAIFDLALRRLDLITGEVLDHTKIADGPIQKWPSVVDVDERGIIVMYRQADRKTTTFIYLAFE